MTLQPTRRTVLGAAAWSAPAIVVASAAPALAASTGLYAVTTATRAGIRVDATTTITNATTTAVAIRLTITTRSPSPNWYGAYAAGGSIGWNLVTYTGPQIDPQGIPYLTVIWDSVGTIPAGQARTFTERFDLQASTTYSAGTVTVNITPTPTVSPVTQPPVATYPAGSARAAGRFTAPDPTKMLIPR